MAAINAGKRQGQRLARSLYDSIASSMYRMQGPTTSQLAESFAGQEAVDAGCRMASNQAVRNRLKSVKSIQKITKAMKMVAASKLRGVQVKAEQSRGLWQPFTYLLGDHIAADVQRNVVLAVTTDRGLCGGINSAVVRQSRAMNNLISLDSSKDNTMVILGEKGRAQLQQTNRKQLALTFSELSKLPMNFTQISMVVDDIINNIEFDALRIVYNRFRSVICFEPSVATVLGPQVLAKVAEDGTSNLDKYEIEGEETKEELLQNLSEFKFAAMLYNASLENACSEMGARMTAMDNSSRNASDMLNKLTLSYNRSRQASITNELIEIISGASALEEKE